MVFWKLWFDLRWRFWLCLALTLLISGVSVGIFRWGNEILPILKPDMSAEQRLEIEQLNRSYRLFRDEGWFYEIRFVSVLAAFLALGGVVAERKNGTMPLTLSLPVSRRRWLIAHALLVLLLTGILLLVASLLILVCGWTAGESFPPTRALFGMLVLMVRSLPWISAAIAFTVLFENRVKAALFLILSIFALDLIGLAEVFQQWRPAAILTLLEGGPFPWKPLVSIALMTAVLAWFAVRTFENRDF